MTEDEADSKKNVQLFSLRIQRDWEVKGFEKKSFFDNPSSPLVA